MPAQPIKYDFRPELNGSRQTFKRRNRKSDCFDDRSNGKRPFARVRIDIFAASSDPLNNEFKNSASALKWQKGLTIEPLLEIITVHFEIL
ncbi:hypothetical protein L596_014187 [Steinernema carpocapsae]|uniref:Uncharacterized protein n=1 Tax=Steinernema carpocapsae TaxID=34508 RepID=A0A4U5NC49_STECR|nr:hypothetical protein L596_014187 [Steinernema carpocapsae]